jgi:hypothetical protein
MTFEEHNKAVEFSYNFYDAFIDFEPYFDKCDTLDDLKESLYEDYKNNPLTDNDFMRKNLFNCMSNYNLLKYLKKRYGDRFAYLEYSGYYIAFK